MKIVTRTIVLMVSLVTLVGSTMLAQEAAKVSALFQQLQVDGDTRAYRELLKLGRTSPDARKYLAANLPRLIEKRATGESLNGWSWVRAVRLAGELKIADAAPALVMWIGLDNMGTATLALETRLETDPAGKALVQIGEPSVHALTEVLKNGNIQQRTSAVYALRLIASTSAEKALRDQLERESDPSLRSYIEQVIAK